MGVDLLVPHERASTPQVEESVVSFAGTSPKMLLLYCHSRILVARHSEDILVHDHAFSLPAQSSVLLRRRPHLCLDTRESEFNLVFGILATLTYGKYLGVILTEGSFKIED